MGGGVGSGGGAGGGGVGNRFASGQSEKARYHKSESYSFQIKRIDNALDISEIVSSLKSEVEKEIAGKGAEVKESGHLDSARLYFEYDEEGIEGRLEIAVQLRASNCTLSATVTETSTSTRPPAVERRVFERRKPEGSYYVVPFMPDDVRGSTNAFYDVAAGEITASRERLRQKLLSNPAESSSLIKSLPQVEIYCWQPVSSEMRERWKEITGEEFDAPAEYEGYGRVYFLNDAALRIYKEAGEDFDVLKIVPGEEVPHINGPSLAGPYVPKSD